MVPSFSFLGFILALVLSLSQTSFTDAANGFTVDLIHRDSIKSPLYNTSDSFTDRIRASIRRSHSRSNAFQQTLISKSRKSNTSFDFGLVPSEFEYLMTIQVGTPPRDIVAIADTGSDLIWTNCKPCNKCYKQDAPLFDPKNSSSYHGIRCNSDTCRRLRSSKCPKKKDKCNYRYLYGDGSRIEGFLANESFYFNTSNGGQKRVHHVSFGCSYLAQGLFDRHQAGIVGLGGGPLSLVSQLGSMIDHKFSYCLARYTDKNVTSKLNFGSNAIVSGPNVQSTPRVQNPLLPPTYYVAQLSGVKVGEMDIKMESNYIIIDSGTTMTYLMPAVAQQVVQEVTKAIHLPRVKDSDFDICFNVSGQHDYTIDQFPDVVLTFGIAKMRLGPKNAFVLADQGKVCLAIVGGDTPLLGNIAQQDFHVGYDLGEGKIYFSETDCAKRGTGPTFIFPELSAVDCQCESKTKERKRNKREERRGEEKTRQDKREQHKQTSFILKPQTNNKETQN
ncbi:hypothetical protein LUZ60_017007 [Juncus effusus]|nr:hypothetical protein LUZ60_017007 [Juncus effusus]